MQRSLFLQLRRAACGRTLGHALHPLPPAHYSAARGTLLCTVTRPCSSLQNVLTPHACRRMKPGFSKKSNKKKNKQKKKAGKGKGDADDIMQDAAAPGSPLHMQEAAPAATPELITAKDKQRQKMELKKALKVKVANLKSNRNKLTKLAGNKTERRQLSKQLQGLLQDQLLGKGGKKNGAAAAADTMAE